MLGVDYGAVRHGIAWCDPDRTLASPLQTVPGGEGEIEAIADLAEQVGARGVIVGLPLSLDGQHGAAADRARHVAERLAARLECEVRLLDERNTTREAARAMREAGLSAKSQRTVVDQQAAVVILQQALEAEQRTGEPAGVLVKLSSGQRREGPTRQ